MTVPPMTYTLFPYTTLFRSTDHAGVLSSGGETDGEGDLRLQHVGLGVNVGAGARGLTERNELGDGAAVVGLLALVQPQANERGRSEEHTSELQSRGHLVCRL